MDNLTKAQRHRNMQNIQSQGTAPERLIMRGLKKRGIYFSKYSLSIIGKPDIVFRKKKTVVFIDSDFWHKHPKHFITPKTNVGYWKKKIEYNVKRDAAVGLELKKRRWRVIRLWEYDIKHNTNKCIGRILRILSIKDSTTVKRD